MNFLEGFWKTKLDEPRVKRYGSFNELPYTIYRPSIQRAIMEDSVVEMRQHIREMHDIGRTPIFGVIDVCILNDTAYVVDGQHRLKALEEEWKATRTAIPFYVMEYIIENKLQLEFIFVTRNKGIAVPSYILSDEIEGKKRELLKEIQSRISRRPLFVSTSGRSAYRPRVCIGEFMEQLTRSRLFAEIWSKYSDCTVEQLADYFDEILNQANLELARLATTPDWVARQKVTTHMISVCTEHRSFFGLTMDRLYFEEFFIPRTEVGLPTLK